MELHLIEYWQAWWALSQQTRALSSQYPWEVVVVTYLTCVIILSHFWGILWVVNKAIERKGK